MNWMELTHTLEMIKLGWPEVYLPFGQDSDMRLLWG